MKLLPSIVLLLIALAACGKDDSKKYSGPGAGKVASCKMPSVQSCREYRDANLALGTESLERLCTGAGGSSDAVFGSSPCPTEKVTGTCKKNEHKDFIYEGYPISVADFEASCTGGDGKFSAKP
jgi:hypothetical protein